MTDEVIGRYRILATLGEGGMGVVYRALDERLSREVAIKLLKKQDEPQALERFFREARAASALNHPNIVTVFEAGEDERGPFIVMELVKGQNLRSLIGQPVGTERLISLGRQTAEALTVAHRAGIVHRDVKPENLMLRDDGYVKVLDFGLARRSPQAVDSSETQTAFATGAHTIVGTAKYMSPEQVSSANVGSSSDVFSLGVVLYELSTGQHPFQAESHFGVLHAILAQSPVSPSRLNPELSGPLELLILRMLDKDPSLRPEASEVATALTATGTLLAARTHGEAAFAPTASKRRLVGREKGRGELQAALDYVGRRRGLLVCVSGEPGLGKSTLVEDFLSDITHTSGAYYVARGRCSERLAGTEAYLPLLDALDSLVRSEDGGLARLMKAVAPSWYVQVATPSLQDAASWSGVVRDVRSGTQERLKRELVAFLTEGCRQRPFVFFFDDVHWVDSSTIDVLNYLARQFDSLPVLIIAAYRPEELLIQKHPFLSIKRELQSRGACREVGLEFLTRKDTAEYISATFPSHHFSPSFVELIHTKTEGNPLFMMAVLSYLAERQVLSREHDEWTLTRSVPDIASDLPESVRSMIQRKIDALDEGDRRVLVAASVQGYEFDGAVVARALGMDPADVEERLETLDRVHAFVRAGQEQEFPDRNRTLTLRYQFVHVLYQNTLYASMTPARKAALSRAVATALEGFHGDRTADVASELAVLFEVAREWSLATNYYRIAAKKAADVFANEEALVLGRRALDQLRALPDGPARHRQELDILLTIGVPATAARGYSSRDVQEIYDRASALCMELQETDPLARVLRGLFAYNIVRLQLNAAQEACDRMNDLARRSEEPSIALGTNAGAVHYYRGEFEAAAAYLESAAVTDDLDMRRSMCVTFGYDPLVGIHNYLGWSLWCLGYPDRARTVIQKSLEFAGEMNPYTIAFALTFASGLSYWCGDWEQLRIHNERTLALAKKEGFAYFAATSICLEGLWLAAHNHLDEGLVRIRKGWDALSAIEGRATQLRFASDFADCLARAGRWEEAFDLLTAELDAPRTARFHDAELIRVKGELLLMRGGASGTTQAEACFEQALDVARRQRAKSFELRAVMSLVRLWHAQGKSTQAASLLRVTYDWFTEGHETADLRRARELLGATAEKVP